MHRLFVALRLPREMRRRLLATMSGISAARWQDDDQLHLTLRFIGEVDRHGAEDVAAALYGVRGATPTLSVEGVGTFERRGRTTALWAAVPLTPELAALQRAVERAMTVAGRPAEPRAFRPHITLARLPRGAGPIDRWLAEHAGLRLAPTAVDCFLLYRSTLTPEGSLYEAVARYPLA